MPVGISVKVGKHSI